MPVALSKESSKRCLYVVCECHRQDEPESGSPSRATWSACIRARNGPDRRGIFGDQHNDPTSVPAQALVERR